MSSTSTSTRHSFSATRSKTTPQRTAYSLTQLETIMRRKAFGRVVDHPKTGTRTWKPVTGSLKYRPKSDEDVSFE